MKYSLVWFRRDLRLADNKALAEASASGQKVVCIYIINPKTIGSDKVGDFRLHFFYSSLLELKNNLEARGSKLLIFQGEQLDILKRLVEQNPDIEELHFNEDYDYYGRLRDRKVAKALGDKVKIKVYDDQVIFAKKTVTKADGHPYTVFTPYKKAWLVTLNTVGREVAFKNFKVDVKALATETDITQLKIDFKEIELERVLAKILPPSEIVQSPGEKSGIERVREFISPDGGITRYKQDRDFPSIDGTARISAHLKLGTISIRNILREAYELLDQTASASQRESIQTWISELIWREFYKMILVNFEEVNFKSFQPRYRQINWQNNAPHFSAWKEGKTGYPFVDAGMRQLKATGWMHNRLRMVVAMFLTKDLLINWQEGEKYFMQMLIDGDAAANNGGWQWSAGTGTDAAPYFRIFNPITQGLKFDPNGDYIRKWIPELANLPAKTIHEPWKLEQSELAYFGVTLGETYPHKIVEHSTQREKALEIYKTR